MCSTAALDQSKASQCAESLRQLSSRAGYRKNETSSTCSVAAAAALQIFTTLLQESVREIAQLPKSRLQIRRPREETVIR